MKRRIAKLMAALVLTTQTCAPVYAYESHGIQGIHDHDHSYETHKVACLNVRLQLDYIADFGKEPLIIVVEEVTEDGMPKTLFSKEIVEKTKEVTARFEELTLDKTYTVEVQSKGYKYFKTEIKMDATIKELRLSGSNQSFTAGDVNADGQVNQKDLDEMQNNLGEELEVSQLASYYDLDRNGKIDLLDIAQVFWNQTATGNEEIVRIEVVDHTVVDVDALEEAIKAENNDVVITGDVAGLFNEYSEEVVTIETKEPISIENPVVIPIPVVEEVEEQHISQIQIVSQGEGTITGGYVSYEDENGKIINVPFRQEVARNSAPFAVAMNNVFSMNNVITINLGKQIPLQKITIHVTETTGSGLLAAISQITFLEDVVDDALNQETGEIKNFTGVAEDEGVTLNWSPVPNTNGYKVQYGTVSGVYTETAYATDNAKTITGLENGIPYYFVVQATNDTWEGPLSEEISIIPDMQKIPDSPANIKITPENESLILNYSVEEDSHGVYVYYKKQTDADYQKIEAGGLNTHTLLGLVNDQVYEVYLTAYNKTGESAPSEVLMAIPSMVEIKMPQIPTYNRIDSSHVVDIVLRDPRNVNLSFYPEGYDNRNMIDGDFFTHWTANTYQQNRGIVVTFDQPYEMDYVAFTTRLDKDIVQNRGWYKNYPWYYGIKVWETPDSEGEELLSLFGRQHRIPQSGEEALFVLPFPKSQVYKIEISLYEYNGAGQISISEVMFYEYYDLIDRIDALFANGTYTELVEGVTLEQIEALETELLGVDTYLKVPEEVLLEELQIAKDLLVEGTNEYITENIIVTAGRNILLDADRQFENGRGISALQPTGYLGMAGDEILVYVDVPEDAPEDLELPILVASQFYGTDTYRMDIPLVEGRNVITVPQVVSYNGEKGGTLYLEYQEELEGIEVQIRHAREMPTLEILDLDDTDKIAVHKQVISDYITYLKSYMEASVSGDLRLTPKNSTEVATSKVLLSLPADQVLEGIEEGIEGDLQAQVDRVYETLLVWEATLEKHYEILGLTEHAEESKHRWPTTRMNVRYMPTDPGVLMYASASHIGVPYQTAPMLMNETLDSPNGYFGWGINHEIGHVINTNEYIYDETSNNIFSLFLQTINDGESRLELNDIYPLIYDKVVSEDSGLAGNVFVTLGMFWQLHLAYDDYNGFEGIDAFYPRLNRAFRDDLTEGVDRHNMLARLASDVVQKDLTPFFEKWDLPINAETKAYTGKYEEEKLAIYYLNDDAKRYKDAGKVGVNFEEVVIEGSVRFIEDDAQSNEVVEITVTQDESINDDVLGYEIYRNDELIAFTMDKVYRDQLPEGVNRGYDYEIVVYDKCLNHSSKINVGSVQVDLDGVLDKTNFTFDTTTSGQLVIDMQNVQEVVGLKIDTTHTALEKTTDGALVIEVSEDGKSWTKAKEAGLEKGENILYFNKPGVDAYDQRIWTYDARYIRVRFEDVAHIKDIVEVVAYPGDAVYFTEGAIGRLGHDYVYNGGVIEEGSLVVLGTYRGHPVYSKIVVSAKYINDKAFDEEENPGYEQEKESPAVNGELFMFAELPEDNQVSKVNNGIWLFAPEEDQLPDYIKANMFRTDEAESVEGGRLVSDTLWLMVPSREDLPIINLIGEDDETNN